MKIKHLFESTLEEEAKKFFDNLKFPPEYTINGDVVDVKYLNLSGCKATEIPFKLGKSDGYCYVSLTELRTLKNMPDRVKEFTLNNNVHLKSLDGLKVHVERTFALQYTHNIANIHKHVTHAKIVRIEETCKIVGNILGLCLIDGLEKVVVYEDKSALYRAAEIINRHLGKGKAGAIAAQAELIEADLDDFAQL